MKKISWFIALCVAQFFSVQGFAQQVIWQEIASDLVAPYAVMLLDNKTYVSTAVGIVEVDEATGSSTIVSTLAEGSPSGLLLDTKRRVVGIENGTGSLVEFSNDFSTRTLLAGGLGDPITVKEFKKWYLITDYNFGSSNGRLLRVKKHGRHNGAETIANIDGPGSFSVSESERAVYIAKFDDGALSKVSMRPPYSQQIVATGLGTPLDVVSFNEDGFIVSDFGGFDGEAGNLLHVGKNGRVTVLDDSTLGNPAGLFVHGGTLYVTDLIGGRLFKANLFALLAQTQW